MYTNLLNKVLLSTSCSYSMNNAIMSWFEVKNVGIILLIALRIHALAEIFQIPLRAAVVEPPTTYEASDIIVGSLRKQDEIGKNHKRNGELSQSSLRGKPGQGYFMDINIGTPPQKLSVLLDTGSSNLAVAASAHPYVSTYFNMNSSSSFTTSGETVTVPYTQGMWQGLMATDIIHPLDHANLSVVANVACITHSIDFFINGSNWQGILGMGYSAIARPDEDVTPFFDSLVKQHGLDDIFSLQLCGVETSDILSESWLSGTLVLGGVDEKLYKEPLLYSPVVKEWYYEILLTSIEVNGDKVPVNCEELNSDKTIVDSGTTNLRLPQLIFTKVIESIKTHLTLEEKPPEDFWSGSKIICWPMTMVPWSDFPNLSLSIAQDANSTFKLHIVPQQYLRVVSSDVAEDCLKFSIAYSDSGTVIGAVILEGFYIVFDRENQRIGFAQSTCDSADSFVQEPYLDGPFEYEGDTSDCAYSSADQITTIMMVGVCILGGIVCLFILVPIITWFLQLYSRRRGSRQGALDSSTLLKEENQ